MLDIEGFRAWLQERKGSTFRTHDARACPLAKYSGGEVHVLDGCVWESGKLAKAHPEWAKQFIRRVDKYRTVSGYYCLAVLEDVEHG